MDFAIVLLDSEGVCSYPEAHHCTGFQSVLMHHMKKSAAQGNHPLIVLVGSALALVPSAHLRNGSTVLLVFPDHSSSWSSHLGLRQTSHLLAYLLKERIALCSPYQILCCLISPWESHISPFVLCRSLPVQMGTSPFDSLWSFYPLVLLLKYRTARLLENHTAL